MIRPGVTNEDPRIQNLVVGDHRAGARVQVFGEEGEPVVRAIVRLLDDSTGKKVYTDYKGQCVVEAKEFPVKVSLTGFGYGEKKVSLEAGKNNKVILARGMTIELHTKAKAIGKDPDYHLGFFIYHVDARGRGVTGHVYEHAVPYQRLQFDARGRATIPVPGPGTYEVQPRVYILGKDNVGRGGWVGKSPFPRIQVVAHKTSQSFEIHVSAGDLADAIRRYSK